PGVPASGRQLLSHAANLRSHCASQPAGPPLGRRKDPGQMRRRISSSGALVALILTPSLAASPAQAPKSETRSHKVAGNRHAHAAAGPNTTRPVTQTAGAPSVIVVSTRGTVTVRRSGAAAFVTAPRKTLLAAGDI